MARQLWGGNHGHGRGRGAAQQATGLAPNAPWGRGQGVRSSHCIADQPLPNATLLPSPEPPSLPSPEPAPDSDDDIPDFQFRSSDSSSESLPMPSSHTWFLRWRNIKGHPIENCAADNWHFLRSLSLVYHFMVIKSISEDTDIQLLEARLQCVLCHAAGMDVGRWRVKRGGSTGWFLIHFSMHHTQWWAEIMAEDKKGAAMTHVLNPNEVNVFCHT